MRCRSDYPTDCRLWLCRHKSQRHRAPSIQLRSMCLWPQLEIGHRFTRGHTPLVPTGPTMEPIAASVISGNSSSLLAATTAIARSVSWSGKLPATADHQTRRMHFVSARLTSSAAEFSEQIDLTVNNPGIPVPVHPARHRSNAPLRSLFLDSLRVRFCGIEHA